MKSFVMCKKLVILPSYFDYKIDTCMWGNLEKHKENKVPF